MEHATLEMFISVIIDENENCEPEDDKIFEYKAPEPIDVREDWHQLKESDPSSIFIDKLVLEGCELEISIRKQKESIMVQVGHQGSEDTLDMRISPEKSDTQIAKLIR